MDDDFGGEELKFSFIIDSNGDSLLSIFFHNYSENQKKELKEQIQKMLLTKIQVKRFCVDIINIFQIKNTYLRSFDSKNENSYFFVNTEKIPFLRTLQTLMMKQYELKNINSEEFNQVKEGISYFLLF